MKKNTRIKHRKYNSRKKYIFPLVALSILLVISVAGVFANTGDTFIDSTSKLKYEILTEEKDTDNNTKVIGGTVAIVGYDGTISNLSTLAIPAEVTNTNNTVDESDDVTYKVTSIGENAFLDYTALTTIDFTNAENLENIRAGAFKVTGLTSLDFDGASNLSRIFKEAFMDCSNLESVKFADNAKISLISQSAFENCTALESVSNVPASTKLEIGQRAFYNCVQLTSFTDLANAENVSIADGAFWGCCYLKGDIFPEGSNPFGSNLIQNFDTELRGVSIKQIVPAEGNGATDKTVPENIFKGQDYKVVFNTPAAGYSIAGLDFLDSTEAIPEKYVIDSDTFNEESSTKYSFAMPDSDNVILFAVATKDKAESGAPTITTDKLADGVKGQPYSFQLEVKSDTNVITWSVETEDGTAANLPAGFTLDSASGKITSDKIEANAENYEFVFVADNGISTHKKLLSLKIYDNKLSSFGEDSLWWEESGGKVSVAWEPLKTGSSDSITYYIQIYDEEGNKVGNLLDKTLQGTFPSEFASIDVTDIIKEKGTYHFTIEAVSSTYGASVANSADTKFSKGTYAYGYEEYTITATTSGAGTGKIALSDASYQITGLEAEPISNGIEVVVREDSVSESTPLTFLFTPDKGCEVTALTVDSAAIKKNTDSYTFTSIGGDSSGDSSANTGGSSAGSSTGSSSVTGDSGTILLADETNSASSTGSKNHNIVVEFSLVSNNIDGDIIAKGTYIQGEKASFQAIGDDMDAVGEVDGVTRWIPKYWWLDDETLTTTTTKHSWTSEPYTDAIDTTNLSLGTHTLYVAFQKQNYVGGTGWVDSTAVNSTDVRSVDFVVTDKAGNTTDPDADTNPDADTDPDSTGSDNDESKDSDDKKDSDTSSGDKSTDGSSSGDSSGSGSVVDKVTSVLSGVDTGDDMVMVLWVALALISLVGIGFCVRQILKYS